MDISSRLSAALLVLLFGSLTACGSGGGDGDDGSVPAAVATTLFSTTVSGTVIAPGGVVAFRQDLPLLDRFFNVIFPSSYASTFTIVSPRFSMVGLLRVPDGTIVELVRIDDSGNVLSVIATTTTTFGNYSFDLTALGLDFASDLVIQVFNPVTNAQLRAFVTGSNVDIDPFSETAFRMVVEQIASNPLSTLADLTTKELDDIAACVDLYITLNRGSAGSGVDIESMVTAFKNTMATDVNIVAFITAAAQPGQTNIGPGDIGDYFPFDVGLTWKYNGTITVDGGRPTTYPNTVTITTDSRIVNGTNTTVFSNSNFENSGPDEDVVVKDSLGISDWDDTTLTDLNGPLRIIQFPLNTGSSFKPIDGHMFQSDDLDNDGIKETATFTATVTVVGFENITVPAGTFTDTMKIMISGDFSIKTSSSGTATATLSLTEWYAPGTGLVKLISQTVFQLGSNLSTETVIEELAM